MTIDIYKVFVKYVRCILMSLEISYNKKIILYYKFKEFTVKFVEQFKC
jgi:hypothetical protein